MLSSSVFLCTYWLTCHLAVTNALRMCFALASPLLAPGACHGSSHHKSRPAFHAGIVVFISRGVWYVSNGCLLSFVTDSVWNLFAKRFMTQFSQLMVHSPDCYYNNSNDSNMQHCALLDIVKCSFYLCTAGYSVDAC